MVDDSRGRSWLWRTYHASRSRFFFVVIGIPSFILLAIVLWSFIVFIDIMLFVPITVVAVALLPRAYKTKKILCIWSKSRFYFPVRLHGYNAQSTHLGIANAATPGPPANYHAHRSCGSSVK